MISFVVRDGRHFMVHLKIKRTGVVVPSTVTNGTECPLYLLQYENTQWRKVKQMQPV